MMREYILRSQAKDDKWKESTPKIMQELMAETYGVMVYQEDVIKVAHYFAGLDLGEADMLRRGMSGKFRSRTEFAKVKQKFFDNCKTKGYPDTTTVEVWRQTESFAGYAFSKGHSASYAVESYMSLYLKAHYPMEFILGVLNNGGGFYSTEMYLHEARMLGAEVEAPCVNHSVLLNVLEDAQTIYIGFYLVRDLEERVVEAFLAEREQHGTFTSLADFVNRCAISKEQLMILVRVGAFRFSGKSKPELLWELHRLLGNKKKSQVDQRLFPAESRKFKIPELDQLDYEEAFDQMELLGFPLCSPFSLLKESPATKLLAKDLMSRLGKQVSIVGYLVTVKNTKTTQGKLMQFGTFVDQEGGWIDTVHFPPIVNKMPFRGKGCYLIEGKVVEEFGYASIEVSKMQRLDYVSRGE
jgi:DNA polymerase-3 subunit alpha